MQKRRQIVGAIEVRQVLKIKKLTDPGRSVEGAAFRISATRWVLTFGDCKEGGEDGDNAENELELRMSTIDLLTDNDIELTPSQENMSDVTKRGIYRAQRKKNQGKEGHPE